MPSRDIPPGYFNPRSPCGERRKQTGQNSAVCVFQSTLPVRGATVPQKTQDCARAISIHAPRAGSDSGQPDEDDTFSRFQSTLPVRGATAFDAASRYGAMSFQSTLPVRGATTAVCTMPLPWLISIHAPRAGSDHPLYQKTLIIMTNFNPRSPCGERRMPCPAALISPAFQSTLPVRGATPPDLSYHLMVDYFNPRSPCGERLFKLRQPFIILRFQSTLPVRGATCQKTSTLMIKKRFQSTLPVRGATPNC